MVGSPSAAMRGDGSPVRLTSSSSSSSSSSFCSSSNVKAVAAAMAGASDSIVQGVKRRRISFGCSNKRLRASAPTSAPTPQVRYRPCSSEAAAASASLPLSMLTDGVYFTVASWLAAPDLARVDSACRHLRMLNGQPSGPWQEAGKSAFFGMELDIGGAFFPFEQQAPPQKWKSRYKLFHLEAPTFSTPFSGNEITAVEHHDEVAYCRCRLRTDLLASHTDRGVYIEVEVHANADNLSLAVVDFEGGGRSSVTFSPETGAVLRERKVRESPRAIEGTYIHLLPAAPHGQRFEGVMGLYLRNGHLAFFRRWGKQGAARSTRLGEAVAGAVEGAARAAGVMAAAAGAAASATVGAVAGAARAAVESPQAPWESTGYCTDLRWAQGSRLSLCLAFRDDGAYHVRIARVSRQPPIEPKWSEDAYQDDKWHLLYGDDDHPLAI
mmetsp:Transcript_72843/g.138382  ORF Transcript_72843/g.138382 Transcript_72843/m.138382 type:complete len:438 (-) Transcript_72843:227-1540(-)